MRGVSGQIRVGSISRRWAKLKVLNQSTKDGFKEEELSPCCATNFESELAKGKLKLDGWECPCVRGT